MNGRSLLFKIVTKSGRICYVVTAAEVVAAAAKGASF